MRLKTPVNINDHIQGNKSAHIELLEYGDYECSYCGKAYPVVKKLQQEMGNNMKFVFRNFPLDMHPHAYKAAVCAEVANEFGKFWEMHDLLYENQRNLRDENLLAFAQKLGIDLQEFEQKFSEQKLVDRIEADLESGLRSGVNGTPSFYINGEKFQGDPYSVDEFLEYFQAL